MLGVPVPSLKYPSLWPTACAWPLRLGLGLKPAAASPAARLGERGPGVRIAAAPRGTFGAGEVCDCDGDSDLGAPELVKLSDAEDVEVAVILLSGREGARGRSCVAVGLACDGRTRSIVPRRCG